MRFWQAMAWLEPDQYVPLAQAAERSGFHGVTLSDHLFYPRELRSEYPYSSDGRPGWQPDTAWPDPWVTIAALAQATERLRFTTNVYVAPARDLFTVAKLASTAAVLSGGRVAIGVGAGWCAEEFAQTGQDFASRGRRLNEMIPALRSLWAGGWAEFHGEHYDFDAVQIAPVPAEPIPVYVGGDSPAALRRAARLADGWIGVLYDAEQADAKLAELQRYREQYGTGDQPFEIILSLLAIDDIDLFRRYADRGVTGFIHAPWMLASPSDGQSMLDARIDATERFGETVLAQLT